MLTLAIVFCAIMLQMFLLLGGVIGYLVYGYLATQASALPSHPEFYDEEGNVLPDEILAIRFENSYDTMEGWDEDEL